jgi:CheY-like chemotaxis protein
VRAFYGQADLDELAEVVGEVLPAPGPACTQNWEESVLSMRGPACQEGAPGYFFTCHPPSTKQRLLGSTALGRITMLPTSLRRVLIVEDNRDQAESLRLLLQMRGFEVRVAYDGPEGVRAASEWHPDAVLCDIGLPGLDGYGVAAELRRNPATAAALLVAVTGYGSDEDQRRAWEAGFSVHVTKPVAPRGLAPTARRPRMRR